MRGRMTGLATLLVLLIMAWISSIMFGIVKVPFAAVIDTFWAFDGSRDQLIIQSVRLPRAMIAMLVGGSLAAAGCLMQALSRNALAGPELFGINYGAALTTVIASFFFGTTSLVLFTWSAFAGAAIAGFAVFILSSLGRQPLNSVKLVLAGATINLLLASLTQGILILNEQSLDTMRFWLAGSITGRDMQLFLAVLPYMLLGLVGSLLLAGHMNVISLGEEVAQGLGQRIIFIKLVCIGVIVVLAGSAVAIAGPIAFIGLAVPHMARYMAGTNYRWILPYAIVLGALLLLLADIAARFVLPGEELPVGVVTAFLGAPFLIYLAQRKGGAK
ncbi:iron chelate uptake ABC transporter family permease subunit [Paenibacillus sp. KS-LC4]|uniref:FecCD family ABC transporter permease n=1 Tax=Paenibacillus sp. KS-LC4 TaxID=2979727 RepID=UPI0030D23FA4